MELAPIILDGIVLDKTVPEPVNQMVADYVVTSNTYSDVVIQTRLLG